MKFFVLILLHSIFILSITTYMEAQTGNLIESIKTDEERTHSEIMGTCKINEKSYKKTKKFVASEEDRTKIIAKVIIECIRSTDDCKNIKTKIIYIIMNAFLGDLSIYDSLFYLSYQLGIMFYSNREYEKSKSFLLFALRFNDNVKVKGLLCMNYLKLGDFCRVKHIYKTIKGKFTDLDKCMQKTEDEALEYFCCGFTDSYFERVPFENPVDFLIKFIDLCYNNEKVSVHLILNILRAAYAKLVNLDNLINVEGEDVYVFGDTLGQFQSIVHALNAIKVYEHELGNRKFIFNGNFLNGELESLKNFLHILLLFILYPENFYLNRGSNEFYEYATLSGFYYQLQQAYPTSHKLIFEYMLKVFSVLPLCTVINRSIFVVHSGIPEEKLTLENIFEMNRKIIHRESANTSSLKMPFNGLLDLNPRQINDFKHLSKKKFLFFSQLATKNFLKTNNIKLIVRSHELLGDYFNRCHEGKVITIISSMGLFDQYKQVSYIRFNLKFDKNEFEVIYFDKNGQEKKCYEINF